MARHLGSVRQRTDVKFCNAHIAITNTVKKSYQSSDIFKKAILWPTKALIHTTEKY